MSRVSGNARAAMWLVLMLGTGFSSAAWAQVPFSDAVQVAAGNSHTCALTSSGGVKCWGNNSFGQLGDGTTTQRLTAVEVTGLTSGVTAIATGESHTCALTSAGGVKCWGRNGNGQLGDNSTTQRLTAVDVSGLSSGVAAIEAGDFHTCALTSAGGVKCWGFNGNGQLGDGTTTQRLTVVDVSGLTSGVSAIATGYDHTCALTSAGGVKCWGGNSGGQLGDNSTTQRLTAVDVSGLTSGVTAIAAGIGFTCALTTSGGAKCWGFNANGQLGDNSVTQRLTAVDVIGLTSGVAAIAAGGEHTCAMTSASGVKCWGNNGSGQLGDNSVTQRLTAVDVIGLSSGVAAIATGRQHTCALTSTGGVKCWGNNVYGQLGDNSAMLRLTAVDVSELSTDVAAIATGRQHACALTSSGGAKCWADNSFGQLGDGSTTQRLTAVDVSGLSSGVAAIATGNQHTCALTIAGGIKCWGANFSGQLGDGSTTQRLTAVDASGLTGGVAAIATGGATCALTSAGGVKCWGDNTFGQIGDGTTTQRLTAVDVIGLTSGVAAIAAGGSHTCALTSAGGVKCWGYNIRGQLGDNSTTQRLIAVNVSGLTSGVVAIAAGFQHTCALTSAGGIKCWGSNDDGQLGDNSTTRRLTAVNVSGLTSGVAAIAAGFVHTCAMTSAGGVKCWGNNGSGQLGDNSTTQRLTAVDVSGLSNGVAAIATGRQHTCALTSTGGVKCWGSNFIGQLGDGTGGLRLVPVDALQVPPDFVYANGFEGA